MEEHARNYIEDIAEEEENVVVTEVSDICTTRYIKVEPKSSS